MSWFRQQRIASLEVNLADLYYDETKWGWADKLKKRYHGDLEARTKPYRCADCDQPHGPFNNIGSGQSNKPEVTYRLVCDRCWGPKPAAPVEVTDGEARITDEMVEAGAKAMFGEVPLTATRLANTLARACLSAALTQKGEPRACTGCANGCAGCKGKGKPYGEELMRQLRQGQKGDNE